MALRQRLLRDIAELQRSPYPNIRLIPSDDLTNACLILSPPESEQLHLSVEFGSNYPLSPPRISIQTDISHKNTFGSYICASILNTEEGYTPAYDLKGICIQMLSFFASDSIEQSYGGYSVDLTRYHEINRRRAPRQHNIHCGNCGTGIDRHGPINRGHVSMSSSIATPDMLYDDFLQSRPIFNGNSTTNLGFSVHRVSTNGQVYREDRDELAFTRTGQTNGFNTSRNTVVSSSRSTVTKKGVRKPSARLHDLPDELLVLICEQLETEELAPFQRAWDRIGTEAGVVSIYNIIRNRELLCFCLKKGADAAKLGIGVHVKLAGRLGTFESEFDLISEDAYRDHSVRKSVHNISFEHWLPLPLSRKHYRKVKDSVEPQLKVLSYAAKFSKFSTIDTVYAFMNDIVVRLCSQAASASSKSTLTHASEKAIESYYHLFHLLLCLATEQKQHVRAATKTIRDFLIEGKTSKTNVPNLGYLLVACLIADLDVTNDLLMAIIRETITRNVVWMLDKRGAGMAELAYMEADPISHYRLQKTFDASRTSYRLLMFLNLFRRTINRGTGKDRKTLIQLREDLFDAHGAPPKDVAEKFASDVRDLQKVKNFPQFITIMGSPAPKASEFTSFLRNCVEQSMIKKYSVWGCSQQKALTLRQQVDLGVQIRSDPKPVWRAVGNPQNLSFFPTGRRGGPR